MFGVKKERGLLTGGAFRNIAVVVSSMFGDRSSESESADSKRYEQMPSSTCSYWSLFNRQCQMYVPIYKNNINDQLELLVVKREMSQIENEIQVSKSD